MSAPCGENLHFTSGRRLGALGRSWRTSSTRRRGSIGNPPPFPDHSMNRMSCLPLYASPGQYSRTPTISCFGIETVRLSACQAAMGSSERRLPAFRETGGKAHLRLMCGGDGCLREGGRRGLWPWLFRLTQRLLRRTGSWQKTIALGGAHVQAQMSARFPLFLFLYSCAVPR